MKILLAVDGSPYTKKMLAYLAAHDELLGKAHHDFTVLTVQPALPPRARSVLDRETVESYYAEESAKVFDPIEKFMRQHGVTPAIISKVGSAADTICQLAEEGHFDLIIMGTHGHGSLGKLVMGSVSTKVLAGCNVPVLLIR